MFAHLDALGPPMPDADIPDASPIRTGLEEPHLAAAAPVCKVVLEALAPDLMAPNRPFRPGLRVKGVAAHPGVFEMTWDNDGRATFTDGPERVPGQPHVIGGVLELTPSSLRRPAHELPPAFVQRRTAPVFSRELTSLVSEANQISGSQSGSQRRQTPGDSRRHLATISPDSWLFKRR
jgi:hypothetical protein